MSALMLSGSLPCVDGRLTSRSSVKGPCFFRQPRNLLSMQPITYHSMSISLGTKLFNLMQF
jgi:hypothetical protein